MVENTNGGGKQPPRKSFLYYYGLVMLIVMLLNIFLFPSMMDRTQQVRFDQFSDQLKEDNVDEVYVTTNNEIVYTLKNDNKNTAWNVTYKTGEIPGVNLYDLLDGKDVKYSAEINTQASPLLNFLLTWILPLILFVGIGQLMGRSLMKRMGGGPGNAMTFGKSNAKIYAESETGITFADVAGEEEAKDALKEIVDFLHKPEKYSEIGAVLPKGALLVGPPGTGKTMLAKAVAGEAHVPFFSISGSEFVEMFVGMGAAKVRDLFKQANEKAPCIVFIDEIDTIGKKRDGAGMGGNDEREQTLNQLLVEMDGFAANEGVIVIAATNRADILDKALLRPGRFDRQVYVGLPDIKGREEILRVHTRNKPLGPDVVLKTIAKSTAGFTGADLENLVNEAALLAAKRGRKAITEQDIEEASIKVIAGPEKRSRVVTDKDKRITAYHEAGHAIVSYFCKTADPVHEISIIPRGMAAGYTLNLPEDDRSHLTKAKMSEQIVVLLGGRVAEKLVLDDVSTGASNDLERATDTARSMVTRYGFSERLGPVVYGSDPHETFLGRDFSSGRGYSEQVAAEIDGEIRDMLDEAYETARRILSEHMQQLHTVAGALIEREKLTGAEFQTLMQGGTLPPADAPRAKVKPVPVGTQPVQQTPAAQRPEAAERGQAPAQAEAAGPVQESGAAQQPDAPGGAQQDAPQ